VQIGVESGAGSAAANKKLNSLGFKPAVKAEIATFRPMGTKYPTMTALGKEWVVSPFEGKLTFSESIYPLASGCDGGSVQSLGGSPAAYRWYFGSDVDGADTPAKFTVEQGDSTRAHRFSNGLVTGLTFDFSRSEVKISGDMIGKALVDDITMTATPTAIELVPVLPKQVSVYLDDLGADLGDTLLTRALTASWALTDRFGPVWTLNSAEASFAAHVETEPKPTVKLKLEADAAGMALLATMRAGSTKFMRILAEGATISGGNKYTLQIDSALQVANVSEFSDEDGVFAIEWEFTMVYDATWGKVFEVQVINKQSAL
jgi:hypothetical protein